MKSKILFFFFTLFSLTLSAQELITDRPDQTESAVTVEKGYFQIEAGTLLETEGGLEDWTLLTSLFRYGILDGLELRLVTGINRSDTFGESQKKETGISDMEVGFKYSILEGKTGIALISHLLIPNGATHLSNGEVGVINKLSIAHSLGEKLDLGYNLGYDYFGRGKGDFTYTLALGIPLTSKIGFYTELYGALEEMDDLSIRYDHGFTYLLKENLQLDFSFGTGLNHKFNYYALGVSWKGR